MSRNFGSCWPFSEEDEFPLRPDEERTFMTETYNHWAYDPLQDIGINLWFGSGQGADSRGLSNFMSKISVFWRGQLFVATGAGEDNHESGIGAGNAFLTVEEPFKRLRIDYLGLIRAGRLPCEQPTREPPVELGRLSLAIDIRTPPIEQGSQGDRGTVASSGTVPRNAIRYEQLCHVLGQVQIGSRSATVDALGMRSHRRNSSSIYASGAVGHSWAAALFPSGKGIHVINYRIEPDASVGSLYGYYFDGAEYHDGEVLRFPYYTGVAGEERSRIEMLAGGRFMAIDLTILPPLLSSFPPDVRLSQSVVRFGMDGEIGGGLLERSLTGAYDVGGDYAAGAP